MRIGFPLRILFYLLIFLAVVHRAPAESQPRQDRAWKVYQNKESGYCISYPSRWIKSRGFEGVGLSVTTGATRYGMPIASLDVSSFPDEPNALETRAVSLSDDYQTQLTGLRKFVRAEDVETLEERPLAVSGLNALFARAKYYDPKDKSDWIEAIVFTRQNGVLYRLELQTKAEAWTRFQPVFQRFLQSFEVECVARQPKRLTD